MAMVAVMEERKIRREKNSASQYRLNVAFGNVLPGLTPGFYTAFSSDRTSASGVNEDER